MEAYKYLSEVYDALMTDVDTAAWAAYITTMLKKHGARRVLDAGCGTGHITQALAQRGYDMIASDISEEMISVAQQEARRCGISITFLVQDMRCIEVGNPVDAVISTCDGVNYLDRDGAKDVCIIGIPCPKNGRCAAVRHQYDGINLSMKWTGSYIMMTVTTQHVIWNCEYNEAEDTLSMDLTLFVRRGALFERMSEQHVQYAHTQETLCDIINRPPVFPA